MFDHDAQLIAFTADYSNTSATIDLLAYPTPDSETRIGYRMTFSGVKSISSTIDLAILSVNASAGNVVYIHHRGKKSLQTHLQLTGGVISICAKQCRTEQHLIAVPKSLS